MQPRLDGTGGRLHGELDGLGFGLVAAALSAGAPLPERRRELVGERAAGVDSDQTRRLGRHRADRLVQLCADDLARHGTPLTGLPSTADPPNGGEAAGTADRSDGTAIETRAATDDPVDRTRALAAEVTLLVDVDQLLGRDRLPVELLTALTGGRLKVSGPTARRWLDGAGCRLRTIVLDDTGQVLGVGRTARLAPGWLTDANRATDATCQAPGCRTAASVCDLDHHTPWCPTRPDDTPGTTDAGNLGPLCRTDNDAKERQGWQVARRDDGTIRWDHPRSGLTVRTLPWATTRAAARPPNHPPEQRPPPPRTRPAGRDGSPRDRRDGSPRDRRDGPPRAGRAGRDAPPARRRPDRPSALERRLHQLLTRARDPDPPPF